METPFIRVGIMTDSHLSFTLNGSYRWAEKEVTLSGNLEAKLQDNTILFQESNYKTIRLEPLEQNDFFELRDVTIGVDFHWQRKEIQRFKGVLHLTVTQQGILVINEVDVETYLISVISSEMSATASKALLKAHAVISRSWLLAQIEKRNTLADSKQQPHSCTRTNEELICWYDREDHIGYDVCADDHCQRYQGITRSSTPIVEEAVNETCGEILSYDGKICDARFSKCCGGITETFENCWEPTPHPYLIASRDNESGELTDLTDEKRAEEWIRSTPEAFCNTNDKTILSQVLNHYDQETTAFYRWNIRYTQDELSCLIHQKSGINFGQIIDLIPLKRGPSGRIYQLKIEGTLKSYVIGKELEIRRTLSSSHLYSSAFVLDKEYDKAGLPSSFTLTGAGWGHGVGLCQIGAAVMGAKGFDYTAILSHYFQGAILNKKY